LPEVENNEKLKFSPREKLQSGKLNSRNECALENKNGVVIEEH